MALSSFAVVITLCIATVTGKLLGRKIFQPIPEDQFLNVNMPSMPEPMHCYGGFNAINPSFDTMPEDPNTLAVALRALCMRKDGNHAIWLSRLLIGSMDISNIRQPSRTSMDWSSLVLAPDPRKANASDSEASTALTECRIPDLDRADGPEDPRLMRTPGGLFIIVAGYALVPATPGDPEEPLCDEQGFLLHASKVESVSPPRFGPSVPLKFDGMSRVEKNWAMFRSADTGGTVVHAVYSIHPHKIATVDLAQGDVTFQYETYAVPVVQLAEELGVNPTHFHGGAGVAYIGGEEEYYLGIMHVRVYDQGRHKYWNFPYKFQSVPPFSITHIGKKLPLKLKMNPVYRGEGIAFVTTLLHDAGDVFVGYGSGDHEARTLRMPLKQFEKDYFPTNVSNITAVEQFRTAPLEASMSPDLCQHFVHRHICQDRLSSSICRACPDKVLK